MKMTVSASLLAMTSTVFAANYSFRGMTNKNPLEYKKDEPMAFTVTLVDKDASNQTVTDLTGKGIELRWSLSADKGVLDDETKICGTSSANPLTVTALPKASGFVRLTVSVYVDGILLTERTERFEGGAGADVMAMREWPAPKDFASFWAKAARALDSTPFTGAYEGVCTNYVPAYAAGDVEYFLFELPMPNDSRPATGIIAKPAGADPASCGLVVTFDGYGFGPTTRPSAAVAREGNIVMTVARHGEYPLGDRAYYKALESREMRKFCFRNNDGAVQDTDFFKMIMRDLRALQYAKSLLAWNGRDLAVSGSTMGGYRALVASALCEGVSSCSVAMPWCQDLSGVVKFGRQIGSSPAYTPTLGYLEGKNFAKMITCPVTLMARLGDSMCPPSSEVILYRNLTCPKQLTFCQNAGHDGECGIDPQSYVMQMQTPAPEALEALEPVLEVVSSSSVDVALDTRCGASPDSLVSIDDVLPDSVAGEPDECAAPVVCEYVGFEGDCGEEIANDGQKEQTPAPVVVALGPGVVSASQLSVALDTRCSGSLDNLVSVDDVLPDTLAVGPGAASPEYGNGAYEGDGFDGAPNADSQAKPQAKDLDAGVSDLMIVSSNDMIVALDTRIRPALRLISLDDLTPGTMAGRDADADATR